VGVADASEIASASIVNANVAFPAVPSRTIQDACDLMGRDFEAGNNIVTNETDRLIMTQ